MLFMNMRVTSDVVATLLRSGVDDAPDCVAAPPLVVASAGAPAPPSRRNRESMKYPRPPGEASLAEAVLAPTAVDATASPLAAVAPACAPAPKIHPTADVSRAAVRSVATAHAGKPCAVSRK